MKRILLSLVGVVTIFASFGQVQKPISWSYELSNKDPKVGDTLSLVFKAKIDNTWYLYSSDFDPDLGPIVAEFDFVGDPSYEAIDSIRPIGAKRKYDDLWEGEYTYFREHAEFRQTILVNSLPVNLSGSFFYQVCTDVDGKCINLDEDFTYATFTGDSKKSPTEVKKGSEGTETAVLNKRDSTDAYSLWGFMVVAFLAGLAALLTPCVFPMIPMTVTFFTGKGDKKSGKGMALFYGFSIVLIYTLIGSLVAPFMGPEIANDLATGWVPNVIFFLVFIIFALSFLGLFEITLPHKWVNAMDRNADKGGMIGVFFMAFTLVLVSFSCTGPIVGSILVESAGGLILKPILGMAAFSMAFAVPFTLFAFFPNWLSTLPKSGGWLNSVKVVLGFLELALAFKFLSIADQAYHWNILDREIYLAIWIVVFTLLGFYLLGKIQLPGDSKMEKLPVPRLILAVVTFTFVVYMIPGMFGAPLKALAGYLPPQSTMDFDLPGIVRQQGGSSNSGTASNSICEPPKYADMLHFPHGLTGYFDYDQAIACAREQQKPLFIDFTGHGCVNCREMEARVWSDPQVLERLKNDFVLVALYVDEKTELPESQWYESEYDGKIKKSIGKQNADLQITRFNNNAQPFYVILDPNENLLAAPKAYDLNIANFVTFLDEASSSMTKNKPVFSTINP
ncbi:MULTISPECIES: cytochrome c biogenesis protein CcdA [unclassified Imperialibacter]|uniref:protein-disulfide reductase DsbD family protein n=1 Tax=unclassified Imperialibacter TaxID=2629706 RepID=UPI001258FDA5|nr:MULTISPECIES: cytochrome c biogenesis protein CcdA [unclassified Imperialibacter]CAD5267714.1 Thiol:disulfide interchange protein DsbD [Imperialibacter sp. 89]CAD5296159.1 Thiol:disulfide interchange protein DsbD [Imperialibacter sp. 75]VVT33750.1 Thiol:disulfide interchange protein DsbD [Imperialibacter sp. EC-SDR9]